MQGMLSDFNPRVLFLSPFQHPATKKYDLSHIRYLMSGAAPLSSELTMQLVKILPNAQIGQGYGTTIKLICLTEVD